MKHEKFYCGDAAPAEKPYHYKECGLDNIYLMNGYDIEEVDGDQFVSIDSVDELWKAIGLNLVTSKKLLSAKEIKFLRNHMEKTQSEIAALLRVEDQTVARWEKGKVKLSGAADVAFRALFLASDVAQPEGNEVLSEWLNTIRRLVERDTPSSDDVIFVQHGRSWEMQRLYA